MSAKIRRYLAEHGCFAAVKLLHAISIDVSFDQFLVCAAIGSRIQFCGQLGMDANAVQPILAGTAISTEP